MTKKSLCESVIDLLALRPPWLLKPSFSAQDTLMSAFSEEGLKPTTTLGIATPKLAVNAIAPMTVHSTDAIAPREVVGLTGDSISVM